MSITVSSLATAIAVFAGIEAAVLAFAALPLPANKRTHGLLILLATAGLVALGLLHASG